MAANLEDKLIDRVRALPADKRREVLSLVDRLSSGNDSGTGEQAHDRKPLWEVIAETNASLPEDTWDNVPPDGSLNLDHYLYGAPKRKL